MKINMESTAGGRIDCTLVELEKVSETRQKLEQDMRLTKAMNYDRILLLLLIKVAKVRAVKQG